MPCRVADDAQRLAGVVAVEAGPGAVRLGPQPGAPGRPPSERQLQRPARAHPQRERRRPPVPGTGRAPAAPGRRRGRPPRRRDARLPLGDDADQVGWPASPTAIPAVVLVSTTAPTPSSGLTHSDGQEARHRTGVPGQGAAVAAQQLHPQAVAGVRVRALGRRGRAAHLRPACRARAPGRRRRARNAAHRHRSSAVDQSWPAGAIAAVVLGRLGQQHVGPGMHRPAARVPGRRPPGRCRAMPSGSRISARSASRPRRAAQPLDEPAEQRVARVGVVEPAARRVHASAGRRAASAGRGAASPGVRSHHGPGGSGDSPAGVREQLRDRQRRRARCRAGACSIGSAQVQPALVAQPHHQHGGERLGDRADPVRGMRVRRPTADGAARSAPHLPPVPRSRPPRSTAHGRRPGLRRRGAAGRARCTAAGRRARRRPRRQARRRARRRARRGARLVPPGRRYRRRMPPAGITPAR